MVIDLRIVSKSISSIWLSPGTFCRGYTTTHVPLPASTSVVISVLRPWQGKECYLQKKNTLIGQLCPHFNDFAHHQNNSDPDYGCFSQFFQK
ncbi:hypothetical protein GDO81_004597 [Engystomops pustulosus]|uniref:Uncharacterized protein n=1 Tax=Engystomops pustulosus TaxID=76066 RepID=A0AAV6ZU27_ENGPU|nr:hypothetical protein GDO81_004597 [Engystomops pustulosus]